MEGFQSDLGFTLSLTLALTIAIIPDWTSRNVRVYIGILVKVRSGHVQSLCP